MSDPASEPLSPRIVARRTVKLRRQKQRKKPSGTAVRIERTRLLATYLNTIAAGFAVTGVIGPLANILYGMALPAGRNLLQLSVEAGGLLGSSLILHLAARALLGRLPQ